MIVETYTFRVVAGAEYDLEISGPATSASVDCGGVRVADWKAGDPMPAWLALEDAECVATMESLPLCEEPPPAPPPGWQCGIGWELVLLMPAWWKTRRRFA